MSLCRNLHTSEFSYDKNFVFFFYLCFSASIRSILEKDETKIYYFLRMI
jgi:hypothetical protein